MSYGYKLRNGNHKHICPKCGQKTFVRETDESGNELDSSVGKCDRYVKCEYEYTSWQYFEDNPGLKPRKLSRLEKSELIYNKIMNPEIKEFEYISRDFVIESMRDVKQSNLYYFMKNRFGEDNAKLAAKRYCLGFSDHFKDGNIFFYIDTEKRVCAGKIMSYDYETGKREKVTNSEGDTFALVNSLHNLLEIDKIKKPFQPLWGLWLLQGTTGKHINIVESEKSAMFCSIAYPDQIWLASGSLACLTHSRLKALEQFKPASITMIADNGASQLWQEKLNKMQKDLILWRHRCPVKVVNFFDTGNFSDGYDIGDFVIDNFNFNKL